MFKIPGRWNRRYTIAKFFKEKWFSLHLECPLVVETQKVNSSMTDLACVLGMSLVAARKG